MKSLTFQLADTFLFDNENWEKLKMLVSQVTEEEPESADPEPETAEVKSESERRSLTNPIPSLPVFSCPYPKQTQLKT